MIVLGIDPGYRNFATAVVSSANPRSPSHWKNEDIYPASGRASEDDIFWITIAWCDSHRTLLENVTLIVIESQMQARFKIMTTVIRSQYPHKTVLVSPNQMTAHYGLTNKRAEKKQQAMCWCNVLFDRAIPAADKQDDLADAALLALMGITNKLRSKH
jgi:Holliday junction resolvasome RuvABC endonuclease subunit